MDLQQLVSVLAPYLAPLWALLGVGLGLRVQRKNHREQLDVQRSNQREQLEAQRKNQQERLDAQRENHQEQLAEQRRVHELTWAREDRHRFFDEKRELYAELISLGSRYEPRWRP